MSESDDYVTSCLLRYLYLISFEGSIDVSFTAYDIPLSCVCVCMTFELKEKKMASESCSYNKLYAEHCMNIMPEKVLTTVELTAISMDF